MLISICIPCHKREDDLRAVLPSIVAAANANPPVEVVIVDYANPELLTFQPMFQQQPLDPENAALVSVYRGRNHYHMAHARNFSIRAASGEYVMISSADILVDPEVFGVIRAAIRDSVAEWLTPEPRYRGALVCRRDILIGLGGFDERIEFYGPEDKDLEHRLIRGGYRHAAYASSLLSIIPTPDDLKTSGYRLAMNKHAMSRHGREAYDDNNRRGVIVVNEGLAWGQ